MLQDFGIRKILGGRGRFFVMRKRTTRSTRILWLPVPGFTGNGRGARVTRLASFHSLDTRLRGNFARISKHLSSAIISTVRVTSRNCRPQPSKADRIPGALTRFGLRKKRRLQTSIGTQTERYRSRRRAGLRPGQLIVSTSPIPRILCLIASVPSRPPIPRGIGAPGKLLTRDRK